MQYTKDINDELCDRLIKNYIFDDVQKIRNGKINSIIEDYTDADAVSIKNIYNFFSFFKEEFKEYFFVCKMPVFNLFYLEGTNIKTISIAVDTLYFDTLEDIRNHVNSQPNYNYIIFNYCVVNNEHKIRGKFVEKSIINKMKILLRRKII